MFKNLISILILLLSCSPEDKTYSLISVNKNSELNTNALLKIDFYYESFNGNNEELKNLLLSNLEGSFTVYQFKCEYIGSSYEGGRKLFHDYLVLKTKNKKIIDGFQFTQEWKELPYSYDMYRVSNRGTSLKNKMKVSRLNLINDSGEQERDGIITVK